MIRSKFVVEKVEKVDEGFNIVFNTVASGSKENDEFFKATPSGQITMAVVKPEVAERFLEGKEYYVDFTIVPTPKEEKETVESREEKTEEKK